MIWKNLIKTAINGTDRAELSESTLAELKKLGVNIDDKPANGAKQDFNPNIGKEKFHYLLQKIKPKFVVKNHPII